MRQSPECLRESLKQRELRFVAKVSRVVLQQLRELDQNAVHLPAQVHGMSSPISQVTRVHLIRPGLGHLLATPLLSWMQHVFQGSVA